MRKNMTDREIRKMSIEELVSIMAEKSNDGTLTEQALNELKSDLMTCNRKSLEDDIIFHEKNGRFPWEMPKQLFSKFVW